MGSPLCVLVDTNVWVDNYVAVRKGSRTSQEFIAAAVAAGAGLVYPVHTFKDVFYNVAATLKHMRKMEEGGVSEDDALAIREIAWACVENMRDIATAVAADESDAWLACKYRCFSTDLEDNFVIAAAERANASFVVTRDEDLLRKCTVASYTPEDALGYLGALRDVRL